jgi:hypothetical protein
VGVEGSPLGAAHGGDEVIPRRMHEKTHSLTPRSCHLCGRREKATEHAASLSAAKAGWCPEPASRPEVRFRTQAREQARGDGKPTAMPRTAIRACRRTITGRRGCPHIAAATHGRARLPAVTRRDQMFA